MNVFLCSQCFCFEEQRLNPHEQVHCKVVRQNFSLVMKGFRETLRKDRAIYCSSSKGMKALSLAACHYNEKNTCTT